MINEHTSIRAHEHTSTIRNAQKSNETPISSQTYGFGEFHLHGF